MKKIMIIFLLITISCNTTDRSSLNSNLPSIYAKLVDIPEQSVYTINASDTISYNTNNKIKIVNYVDSIGCIACRIGLKSWTLFANELDSLTNANISILHFIHPARKRDAIQITHNTDYNRPICIDIEDYFGKANREILSFGINCFLLDEDNRVILIGNPINNPKIKELYIRTICERLGIESPTNNEESLRLENSLGVFDWHVEQQTSFVINNQNDDIMHIDSLYTSCECTTASIDLTDIEPHGKAIVNVIFKADKIEHFMREIYADIRGGKQIIMTINGEAIE